jgi:hypothetical protein
MKFQTSKNIHFQIKKNQEKEFQFALNETLEAAENGLILEDLLNPKARYERLEEIAEVFYKWALKYFPAFCKHSFNEVHKYITEIAFQGTDPFPIAGPRESGKTTISKLLLIYAICYKKIHVAVIISDTERLASNILKDIKLMIKAQKLLIYDFELEFQEDNDERTVINNVLIQLCTHQIAFRGLISLIDRPDFVLIDDFENLLTLRSQERTNFKMDYVLNEVLPGLNQDCYTLIWLGNLVREFSAIDQAIKAFPKTGRRFKARYKNDKAELISYWPDKFPLEKLKEIENRLKSKPHIWRGEYQQEYYRHFEIFDPDWFKQTFDSKDPSINHIKFAAFLDPASGHKKRNCMKCYAIISIDDFSPDLFNVYLHDIWLDRGLYSKLFPYAHRSMHRLKLKILNFENNAEQWETIKPAYNALDEKIKKQFKMRPFKNSQKVDKDSRIESQVPIFEEGRFFIAEHLLQNPHWIRCKNQFIDFDKGSTGLKDGPDLITTASIHIAKLHGSLRVFTKQDINRKRSNAALNKKSQAFKKIRSKYAR